VPTFIALLRGINVSGHKLVEMKRLRQSFEALGLGNVRTYLQSGNVVFEWPEAASAGIAAMAGTLAEKIERDFGFSVPLTLVTAEALAEVVKENPFLKTPGVDLSKLHVTFLSEAPAAAGLKKMSMLAAGPDRFACRGRSVYLHCPGGYGNTKLSNNAIERTLSAVATTRSWKTVTTLLQMALFPPG
jgi:uncharacterized protein (DUF1697 family)